MASFPHGFNGWLDPQALEFEPNTPCATASTVEWQYAKGRKLQLQKPSQT